MCTVTWRIGAEDLQVFFNRDERRTRKPAIPPALHCRGGVRYLAPTDGDAGGTWMGVNEWGMVACIVNHYPHPFPPAPRRPRSRGLLVADMLESPDPERIDRRLRAQSLAPYPPFQLAAFTPGRDPRRWAWDGLALTGDTLHAGQRPLSTSFFQSQEVLAARRRTYLALVGSDAEPAPERLRAFHRQHDPNHPAQSVCMARPDARTVSYSEVRVLPDEVLFGYLANPLEAPPDAVLESARLPRRPPPPMPPPRPCAEPRT